MELPERMIDAIVFDLYGTLLESRGSSLHREIPKVLGVSRRRWLDLVRHHLLTTSYPDADAFVDAVFDALDVARDEDLRRRCLDLVTDEINAVEPVAGVRSLLQFLRRRGYKLGLLSNLASIYTEPIERLGLGDDFDAMLLSCEAGRTKPDPEVYLELCSRLGVRPDATLFVGDSLGNDVAAPLSLGMRAVWIDPGGEGFSGRASRPAGPRSDRSSVRQVAELGSLALTGHEPLAPLLAVGRKIRLTGVDLTVTELQAIPDDTQGRYNLVYSATAEPGRQSLIVKRFLDPASAPVEELAHRMQAYVGLSSCEASVVDAHEPYLVVSKARGEKYRGQMDPGIARELGRHTIFAYVFSNADMRPRNAFLERAPAGPQVTMIDLEHCFFNLAINLDGLPPATTPQALDKLGRDTLEDRVKKRVLTPRTLPRTRRAFFDREASARRDLYAAYRDGFLESYDRLAADADAICDRLRDRIYREPYLVIGTRAYRRVMAGVDLEDIRSRLLEDPGPVLDCLWQAPAPGSSRR